MGRSRGTFILGTVASGIAAGIPRVARSACVPASCDVGVVGEPVAPDQWRSLAQPRALVLVGGVARGAYQAGVIDALHQAGYEFELICGTSIGAINGALVAQDDYQTLRTMWHSIASLHITEPKPVFEAAFRPQTRRYEPDAGLFNRTNAGVVTYTFFGVIQSIASGGASQIAVFNNANSNAVIEANVNLDRVRKPFAYVATNLDLQQPEAFFVDPERASDSYGPRMADRLSSYTRSVDMPLHQLRRTGSKADAELYWKSVRASGAFPIAFDPIKLSVADSLGAVQEYSYVDGGITANTPLSLAYELSAANILTVFVDPPTRLAPPKKALSLEDLANDVIGTLQERQITKDVYFIEQTKDAPNLFEIRPRCTLEVGVFGFDDQCNIDLAYNRGLADGKIGPIAAKTFRSQRKPY